MAGSKGLRRLRDIRQAQEEQSRDAMEASIAELQRLTTALVQARERVGRARMLISSSAHTGKLIDRIAGLEEIRSADRMAKTLAGKVAAAGNRVQQRRQEFLEKRMERRQVEIVYEAMQARDAADVNRKSQLALDDWYSQRKRQAGETCERSECDDSLIV
jgi:flagellar export protein FliJ